MKYDFLDSDVLSRLGALPVEARLAMVGNVVGKPVDVGLGSSGGASAACGATIAQRGACCAEVVPVRNEFPEPREGWWDGDLMLPKCQLCDSVCNWL